MISGGHTPTRPFEPPVTASHWNAIDQTICANASVSMARYTPDKRTQNHPNSSAATNPPTGASMNASGMDKPDFTAIAAQYAPTPK
jgi:hypothetical protein